MGDPSDSSAELPSLLKNSHISPGPYVPGELFDSRPLDVVHEEMLAASKLFHENVREGAVRVLRRTQLEEAKKRLEQAAAEEERQSERIRIEEERIRVEKQTRDNEVRLRALQATKVEVPPPPPPSPPKPPVAPPTQTSTPPTQSQPTPAPSTSVSQQPPAIAAQSAPQQPSPTPSQPPQTVQQPIAPKPNGLQLGNHLTAAPSQVQPQVAPAPPQSQPAPPKKQVVDVLPSHIFPQSDRYLVIHQNMKELRRHMKEEGKKNKPFNQKMGQMRRLLGTAIGQLIPIPEGAKKDPNNEVIEKIANTLKEALTTVPSPPMDPGMAMVTTPDPTPGAVHNGDSLPMLFIYLLNILSKAIINQFVIEAGVNPKAANHIGTTTVKIFSKRELLWRGHTMIDILMAKFRIACPVVFGLRGNEKTEEGRARVGWRRNDGDWVSEQEHMTRMTGLGAGYASISLRDFSRSSLTNPYPPYNYWHTLGAILSTPPGHTSSTQYVVLKALIDGYEVKFFEFYGRMALTVLEMALVEFPTRATEAHVAVSSLKVIADKLRRDQGLRFHMETAA